MSKKHVDKEYLIVDRPTRPPRYQISTLTDSLRLHSQTVLGPIPKGQKVLTLIETSLLLRCKWRVDVWCRPQSLRGGGPLPQPESEGLLL